MRSPNVARTNAATRTGPVSFDPAIRRSSAVSAAADGYRFSGSADSARDATSASGAAHGLPSGMVARTTLPLRRWVTMAAGCVFGNRGRPESASQSITPAL